MKRLKQNIRLLFIAIILISSFGNASGEPGILLDVSVKEGIPGDSLSFKLVDEREIKLHYGLETASFQANFTLTIIATPVDTENIILNLTLITLPPQPQALLREVLAQNRETFLFDEIPVKSGRVFKVYLTPRIVELPALECDMDTKDREKEEWDELPSSHFFYRYILNSLADMQWATIKDHTENEYKRFRELFGFTQPAMDRMEYYLLPCHVNEITWDDRFDIGLDPTRNKIYTIYTLFEKSLDSPSIGFLLFYRLWGYAPPLLAEGIGNYFSLSHHYTKKLIAGKKWVPLNNLLIAKDYRKQPMDVALWESSSFIRFLVKTYNTDKFKLMYNQATDLTLGQTIEEVYQKSLPTLEKEWLSFLKTQKDSISDYYFVTGMETTNGHYDKAIELYQDMLSLYGNDPGILRSLAYVYYLKGEYLQSEKYYRRVLSGDTLNLDYIQILGNIAGIMGEYDRAKSSYFKVISLDSTYVDAYLKLAELQTNLGDLLPAKNNLEKADTLTQNSQDRTEIYSGLGNIYRKLGDSKSASENFDRALFYARRFVMEFPDNPIAYLRLGESLFNMGEVDSAINSYHLAEFLENKPLYRGKVLLALGKAYQEKNNHSLAKDYFQEVMNIPSGFEEKKQAQEFLVEDNKSQPKN